MTTSDSTSNTDKKPKKTETEKGSASSNPAPSNVGRLRIKIKSYDYKIIDQSCQKIIDAAIRSGATVSGPIPLPTVIKKFTVLNSTFVHKNSRDQYEIRVHKRLIDILNPSAKTIDDLTNLVIPAGVDVEVKM